MRMVENKEISSVFCISRAKMEKTINGILHKRKLLWQLDVSQNLILDVTFEFYHAASDRVSCKSGRNCVSRKFVMESLKGL